MSYLFPGTVNSEFVLLKARKLHWVNVFLPCSREIIIWCLGQFPRRWDLRALKTEEGLDLDHQHCWVCAITVELSFNRYENKSSSNSIFKDN